MVPFFRELVASTSASSGQDSRQSGRSRSTRTAKLSSPSTSLKHNGSETSRDSEAAKRSHQLMSSLAASLASPLVSPGSDVARRMTATSGRKCAALLKKSGPVGSWLRMCLASSSWRSTRCYLTWKPSGTPSWRLLFRLAPSMPRTDGSGSGLWPTPSANETGEDPEKVQARVARGKARGLNYRKNTMIKLGTAVQMWPTPHSSCSTGAGTQGRQGGKNLQTAAAMMPTPTANRRDGLQSHGKNIVCGSLNPQFVEWLMGYPIGYTDFEPWATPSSRTSPRKSDG